MKEICKNCEWAKPTYKGYYCDKQGKKVRKSDTCGSYKGREGR